MSEFKGTPGPWRYQPEWDCDGEQAGVDHFILAEADPKFELCARNQADGLLIAAAPDMLAALVRLLKERNPFESDTDSCECGPNGDGIDKDGQICEHIQAHRAIAKATTPGTEPG